MEILLDKLQMTVLEFYEYNTSMNLKEIDRCVRFRRIDNDRIPALCDGCKNRCSSICVNSVCSQGEEFIESYNKYTNPSEFINEQLNYAQELNVSPYYIVTPISYLLQINTQSTVPGFCVGRGVKIDEFKFNVFWGMESFFNIGEAVLYNMEKKRV